MWLVAVAEPYFTIRPVVVHTRDWISPIQHDRTGASLCAVARTYFDSFHSTLSCPEPLTVTSLTAGCSFEQSDVI